MSVLLAGGGIAPGQIVGASNSRGEVPKERPIRPQDLLVTLYRQLGIDLETTFMNRAGQPIKIGSDGEVIAELEPTARGPYCGSLGYIGFDGSMDTNILIRTLTLGRGWIQFPVGGGVVADSTPEDEYAETLHKAEGLLRALR